MNGMKVARGACLLTQPETYNFYQADEDLKSIGPSGESYQVTGEKTRRPFPMRSAISLSQSMDSHVGRGGAVGRAEK
jgi:hypothetical protein